VPWLDPHEPNCGVEHAGLDNSTPDKCGCRITHECTNPGFQRARRDDLIVDAVYERVVGAARCVGAQRAAFG
jgi:hypothetical protein